MNRWVVIVLFVVLCSFRITGSRDADLNVVKAAEGQLDAFLDKVEPGFEKDFGFVAGDDMTNCTIGKPFRILEFSPEFYSATSLSGLDYVIIKNEWQVPVLCKGQNRVLLKMNGNSGNYVATAMGSPLLAREIQGKTAGVDVAHSFYILRISPLVAEFFVHEPENSFADAVFVPLASAREAIPAIAISGKDNYTLDEVEGMIKAELMKEKKEPLAPAPPKKQNSKKKSLK